MSVTATLQNSYRHLLGKTNASKKTCMSQFSVLNFTKIAADILENPRRSLAAALR